MCWIQNTGQNQVIITEIKTKTLLISGFRTSEMLKQLLNFFGRNPENDPIFS